jgi:hypothetical protein
VSVSTSTASSTTSKYLTKPLGGLLSFGLGVASFPVHALHAGLGTPFGVALIVAGLGVYHVTVNGSGSSVA